jgi:hypothetical protein
MIIETLRWIVLAWSFGTAISPLEQTLNTSNIAHWIYSVFVLIIVGYDLIVRGEK